MSTCTGRASSDCCVLLPRCASATDSTSRRSAPAAGSGCATRPMATFSVNAADMINGVRARREKHGATTSPADSPGTAGRARTFARRVVGRRALSRWVRQICNRRPNLRLSGWRNGGQHAASGVRRTVHGARGQPGRRAAQCRRRHQPGSIANRAMSLSTRSVCRSREQGDLLAIPSAGAYQLSMASNYNMALRPAVVVVSDGKATVPFDGARCMRIFWAATSRSWGTGTPSCRRILGAIHGRCDDPADAERRREAR